MDIPDNEQTQASPYRGRFAPSPTGPLHFGSLTTALASFLEAKSHGGRWLLRMEDLDPPREMPGAADDILRTLEALGLYWDEPVLYQSTRLDAYEAALETLKQSGRVYPCTCSRKSIAALQEELGVSVYPGVCRGSLLSHVQGRFALRLRLDEQRIVFEDQLRGQVAREASTELGDFVVLRSDGLHTYHLASVVDDAYQNITHVMRGADLLDSTAYQFCLRQALDLSLPRFAHLPIAVNKEGQKLSKQTFAEPIDITRPEVMLTRALAFLGHPIPDPLAGAGPQELLAWAVSHWQRERIPPQVTIPVEA
jgi:glutamyl-Q tRNA(Asp) synthetase